MGASLLLHYGCLVVLIITCYIRVDALTTVTVDPSISDGSDATGSNCISGGSLIDCSLRSAWNYCSNFNEWAVAEQSADVNSCAIQIAGGSICALDRDLGSLKTDISGPNYYNFSISLLSSGAGASITMPGGALARAITIDTNELPVVSKFAMSNINIVNMASTGSGGAMHLSALSAIDLENVTISSCSSNGKGGAIFIETVSELAISSCNFTDNRAESSGGGVFIKDATSSVTVTGSTFWKNIVEGNSETLGGGMVLDAGVAVTMTDNEFIQNVAKKGGGAYFSETTEAQVKSCTFTENDASNGGGIFLDSQSFSFSFSDLMFEGNAAVNGGGFYTMLDNNPMAWKDCTFQRNTASTSGGGMFFLSQSNFTGTGLIFNENNATDGGGMHIDGESSGWVLNTTSFYRNYATAHGAGVAFSSSISSLHLQDVNFTSNYGAFQGGGLYFFSSASNVNISYSSMTSNTAEFGGGLFMDQFSTDVDFDNANFVDNTAFVSGGGAYIGLQNSLVNVEGCLFEGNSAIGLEGGALFFGSENTGLSISSTTFHANSADRGGGGGVEFVFENKEITITNAVFTNNTASTGGAIGASTDNILSVSDSSFSFNTASVSGGAITFSSQNTATVTSCTFANNAIAAFNSLVGGGALFVYEYNNVVIDHSTISSNTVTSNGLGGGGILVSSNNILTVIGSTFSNNAVETSGGAIHFVSYNTIDISSSHFNNNLCGSAGGAVVIDSYHAAPLISGNTFTENVANNGGAMFIGDESITSTVDSQTKNVKIDSNQFSSNSAVYGGALILSKLLSAVISNCTFTDNFVITNSMTTITTDSTSITNDYSGGAVALLNNCEDVTFEACTMSNNAAYYGSALYLNEAEKVYLNDLTLTDNAVVAYGTIYWVHYEAAADQVPLPNGLIASGNIQGYGVITSDQNTLFATQGISLVVDDSDSVVNQIITISDYGVDPTINVHVVDYYQSPKYTDEGRSISASAQSGFNGCFDQGTGSVSGQTIKGTLDGFVNYTEMAVSCFPSGNMTLVFSATSLDSATVFVDFEQCADGYYLSNFECTQCPTGEYSLEYTGDTTTCTAAPSNTDSTLTYGNNIYVSPGFWRINNDTTTMTACPYGSDACLGEYRYGTNSCSTGYEGVLCGVCSSGYYESTVSSVSSCVACSQPTAILFVILAPLLVSIAILGVVLWTSLGTQRLNHMAFAIAYGEGYRQNESGIGNGTAEVSEINSVPKNRRQSLVEVYMRKIFDFWIGKLKILIAVYQIVSGFPDVLSVKFPPAVRSMFRIFSFVDVIGFDMPSAECYSTDRFDYADTLMMMTLMPMLVALVILFIALAELVIMERSHHGDEHEKRTKHNKIVSRYFTLFLLLTYLVLPSVSTTIAGAYACTNADPDNVDNGTDIFLTSDLAISCSSPRYEFGVAWASFMLFVYPIGIPAMYFYLLYTNREDIANRLDKSYTPKRCDEALFSVSALGFLYRQYEPKYWYWEIVETIVGSILMAVIFMKLYGYFSPYEEDSDDVLQEVAQYQVFLTLFGALIINTSALGNTPEIETIINVSLIFVTLSTTLICLIFFYRKFQIIQQRKKDQAEAMKSMQSLPSHSSSDDDDDDVADVKSADEESGLDGIALGSTSLSRNDDGISINKNDTIDTPASRLGLSNGAFPFSYEAQDSTASVGGKYDAVRSFSYAAQDSSASVGGKYDTVETPASHLGLSNGAFSYAAQDSSASVGGKYDTVDTPASHLGLSNGAFSHQDSATSQDIVGSPGKSPTSL